MPDENEKGELKFTRREAIQKSSASIAGLTIGAFLTPNTDSIAKLNIDKSTQTMEHVFNKKVTARPLAHYHSIVIPDNPAQSILIGEFSPELVSEKYEIELQATESPSTFSGSDVITQANLQQEYDDLSQFALIAATDTAVPSIDILFDFITNKQTKTLIAQELAEALPPTVFTSSLVTLDFIQTWDKEPQMTRRHFLKLGARATAATGVASASRMVGIHIGNKLIQKQGYKLDTSNLYGHQKDIVEIFNPINKYLLTLRNDVMYLNSYALSGVNIDIPDVQAQTGSIHLEDFTHKFSQDHQKSEREIEKIITGTTQKHITVLLKYANSEQAGQALVDVTTSLHNFYQNFVPLIIRANGHPNTPSIAKVREGVDAQRCKSPHLILCETVLGMNQLIDQAEYSYIPQENEKIRAMLSAAFGIMDYSQEQHQVHDKGFETGFLGNPNTVDKELKVFDKTYGFSAGITAQWPN